MTFHCRKNEVKFYFGVVGVKQSIIKQYQETIQRACNVIISKLHNMDKYEFLQILNSLLETVLQQ